jgi:anti-sigma factor RsiW
VTSATCPDDDQLIAFVLGYLTEAKVALVARHVECCAECEARLRTLDDLSDSIVAALRHLRVMESRQQKSRNTFPNPE